MRVTDSLTDKEKVKALATLLESTGWKLVDEWLETHAANLTQSVMSGKDAEERAIKIGRYRAITEMRAWPKTFAMNMKTWLEEQELHGKPNNE